MNLTEVIKCIKETASRILPPNEKLWLFGLRARGGFLRVTTTDTRNEV